MDWKTSFGGWGDGEELTKSGPGDDVLTTTHMLVSGIFKQLNDFRRCSWCCDQIFEDRECFFLQMKCILSASVEIISYWAWIIISVWENEPKLKETTVNRFALRHYRWTEVYTCSEHGKSVKLYARIVWASLISSLEVARYDCLPHRFSPTFQPPLFSVENWKKSSFQLMFEPV